MEVLGVIETHILGFLNHFGISDELELLVDVHSWGNLHTWKLSLLEQVNHEVKNLDEVISAACGVETQLVDARENDITLEKVYPLFLKVLPAAISLNERKREAEVDYVYIVFPENVIFS